MTSSLQAQRLDVLIIGSTKSYSDAGPNGLDPGVVQEKAFNPTTIATRLQSILAQDSAVTAVNPTVNVDFEDIYKTARMNVPIGGSGTAWDMQFRCFSLAQHFMWPDGKAARMTNLRGEGTYQWDYIVLVEDPYVMAHFPGMFAEGVKLIQSEIAKSANPAQLILLSQWPVDGQGSSSAAAFNEITHRIGDSAGIPVAPGAKAWASYGSKDTSSNHPTPRGEYLAACAVYSKMYPRSASSSGYNYTNPAATGDAIANHVWTEVQGISPGSEYSGKYTAPNAFQMEYFRGRTADWCEYGTSTEEGFANGLKAALASAKVTSSRRTGSTGSPNNLAYSRGTDAFEADKQYNAGTRLDTTDRMHGFPMGDHKGTASTEPGELTMRYGIDKRYYAAYYFYNGTDLGVAHSMVCENEISKNVRGIPVRLLWSKMEHANLGMTSHRDGWHLSNELDRAVGSYLYTVLSGRCPVEAEPADNTSTAWKQWWCRKMGYETAWQMAHLTTRAPGFRVCPSSNTALTIAPGATETMTVEFINPPQSDVTVTVSLSNSTAAIVGPKTLTFTPSNYNTPQQVIVAAIPGASASESFDVNFSTSSNDDVYDGLSDSWAYSTSRASTVAVSQTDNGTTQVTALQNTPLAININAAGSNGSNTIIVGPFNGSVSWSSDSVIEYTPDNGYLGGDVIVYAATVGGVQTIGCIDITVEIPNGQVNALTGDGSASEEGPNTGTFVINRVGGDTGSALNVYFSMGGSATLGDDYTLSHSSPATIAVGQESVTITVTPIDDSVFGEQSESVVLTITPDAAYPIGAASAIVSIADNDNRAPSVGAGPDQSTYLNGNVAWLPTDATPELWLDASDGDSITLNGSTVSQWADKSGKGNHAYQGTAGSQPTYDGTNNKLTFDGNDIFKVTNDPFNGLQNFAVISMQRWSTASSWGNASASYHGESGNGWQLRQRSSDFGRLTFTRRGTGHGADPSPTATVNDSDHIAVGMRKNSKDLTMRHNGLQIYSATNDTGSIAYTGTNRSAIGGRFQADSWGSPAGQLRGDLKEIIVIENPTDDDVLKAEGYLAHKWGVQDSLPNDHAYKASAPGAAGVTVTLNGSATDLDGDALVIAWSQISGPTASIQSPSSLTTDVAMTVEGTYVFRLSVDDGYGPITSDVTIVVNPPLPSAYASWAAGVFANAFNDIDPGANGDADRKGNMMEFAFGTDPTVNDDGTLLVDGSANGEPTLMKGAGDAMEFYFVRRDDHGSSGSVSYTVQFSADLASFTDSAVTPTFVADSSEDSAYEVVKVVFPAGSRFGRVQVEFVP